MKETCLVEIFCELKLEIYDRAVGESISKLAFEAVEKIIKVSIYLSVPAFIFKHCHFSFVHVTFP